MKIFSKLRLATFTAAILGLSLFGQNAFADDVVKTGIQASPASQRVTLDPGARYNGVINVTNTGTTTLDYRLSISPYQVDDKYSPVYTKENAHTQITHWISLEKTSGSIEPGVVELVNYTIDVPLDAPGGSQYAVVFVETDGITEQTVLVNAGTGTVVIAKINGETREEGKILDTNIPTFLLSPPATATVRANNTGNVDEDVRTTIEVKNSLNGSVLYDNSADPEVNTLLPDTERTMTFVVNDIPRLGILSFSITNEYIDDAQIKTATVIVCPLWFIAIIVLIIATIIFRILAKKRDDRRTRANSRNSTGSADKFNI